MAYTETGDNTIFTYDVEKLFHRVRGRCVTRLKMNRDRMTGERNYDEMALTDMEEDDYNVLYPQVAAAIFVLIQTLSVGVEDAFVWDTDEITYATELPDYWDPNKTPVLDSQMMTLLELWVCRDWFREAGLQEVAQEYDILVDSATKNLRSSVVSRTYRAQRKYRAL